MQKGFILLLVLAIIFGVFAIINNAVVPINFIFTEVKLSQAIVIFVSALLGAVITSILAQIRHIAIKKENNQLKTENEVLKSKVKNQQEHNNFVL